VPATAALVGVVVEITLQSGAHAEPDCSVRLLEKTECQVASFMSSARAPLHEPDQYRLGSEDELTSYRPADEVLASVALAVLVGDFRPTCWATT
jgi:hypothetical protein